LRRGNLESAIAVAQFLSLIVAVGFIAAPLGIKKADLSGMAAGKQSNFVLTHRRLLHLGLVLGSDILKGGPFYFAYPLSLAQPLLSGT
jgi:hypothetical protein